MTHKSSHLGLIWQIYSFPLVFMIFLSFSSENADSGFYQKYYVFLLGMALLACAPFASAILTDLKRNSVSFFGFVAFLAVIVVWNFIVSGFDLFYSVVAGIVAIAGSTVYLLGQVRPRLMAGLVRAIILINVGGLLYQYLLWAATGEVVYLHGELFPFSRDRYMLVILGGFERFSGLHLEPGGYSTMMALALIFYRSLTGRVDRTFVIGAISVLFTFATVAMLYFALLSMVLLVEVKWRRPRNFFLALAGVLVILAVLTFGGVIDNILSRFDGGYEGDSSLNVKVLNLLSYLRFSFVELWTGLGIEQVDQDCIGCNYIKSNGVFFYLVYTLGVVGFGIVLALLVRSASNGVICLSFALILLLCRYPVIAPVFWLAFLTLWNWPDKRRKKARMPRRFSGPEPHPATV